MKPGFFGLFIGCLPDCDKLFLSSYFHVSSQQQSSRDFIPANTYYEYIRNKTLIKMTIRVNSNGLIVIRRGRYLLAIVMLITSNIEHAALCLQINNATVFCYSL